MGRIRVSSVIATSPATVWEEIRLIERHADWMANTTDITVESDQATGVGTIYRCGTRFGPLNLRHRLVITSWREGREIGVSHQGWITGNGTMTLSRIRGDRTRFLWVEHLSFPLWLGGPVGGFIGGIVLRRMWRRNIGVLKALVGGDRS